MKAQFVMIKHRDSFVIIQGWLANTGGTVELRSEYF